jgi:hypothetical protein
VLVSTERAEYIGYPTGTTVLHQRHIVLHEVGHLLCGHQDTGAAVPGVAGALEVLAPSLSTELIDRLLRRDVYDDTQEQEAELFASLVLHRESGRRRPSGPVEPGPTEEADRLGALFGSPAHRTAPRPADG